MIVADLSSPKLPVTALQNRRRPRRMDLHLNEIPTVPVNVHTPSLLHRLIGYTYDSEIQAHTPSLLHRLIGYTYDSEIQAHTPSLLHRLIGYTYDSEIQAHTPSLLHRLIGYTYDSERQAHTPSLLHRLIGYTYYIVKMCLRNQEMTAFRQRNHNFITCDDAGSVRAKEKVPARVTILFNVNHGTDSVIPSQVLASAAPVSSSPPYRVVWSKG
ncbi:hypothetical protein RRG08_048413 [Elysia crispata]|uniref:Uncharacterized protein n=1 Tax=Elysia crispata TaxID=231223 RepID=A0AAE1EBW4_9GAST|nr:hypothetical protein RRG08_048413 [Elysia crispata]